MPHRAAGNATSRGAGSGLARRRRRPSAPRLRQRPAASAQPARPRSAPGTRAAWRPRMRRGRARFAPAAAQRPLAARCAYVEATIAAMPAAPEAMPRLRIVPWRPDARPSSSRGTSDSSALAFGTVNRPWPRPTSAMPPASRQRLGCDVREAGEQPEAADAQAPCRASRAGASRAGRPSAPASGASSSAVSGSTAIQRPLSAAVEAEHFLEEERHVEADRDESAPGP